MCPDDFCVIIGSISRENGRRTAYPLPRGAHLQVSQNASRRKFQLWLVLSRLLLARRPARYRLQSFRAMIGHLTIGLMTRYVGNVVKRLQQPRVTKAPLRTVDVFLEKIGLLFLDWPSLASVCLSCQASCSYTLSFSASRTRYAYQIFLLIRKYLY